MKLRDAIQLANGDLDFEIVLFDRFGHRELRVDPDADSWGYEMTRGEKEIVLEFD